MKRYPIPAQEARTEIVVVNSRFIGTSAPVFIVEAAKTSIARIKEEALGILFRIQVQEPSAVEQLREQEQQPLQFSHGDGEQKKKPIKRAQKKVGRNAPCPCGSGKKYKKCCGA